MYYVGRRASETQPLRSLPLYTPAAYVLGVSPLFAAESNLKSARDNLACVEGSYPAACAGLGRANKVRGPMRKLHVAKAFRSINAARAAIRRCRKAIAAAEIALAALATTTA